MANHQPTTITKATRVILAGHALESGRWIMMRGLGMV
jgi:hypothetical protein